MVVALAGIALVALIAPSLVVNAGTGSGKQTAADWYEAGRQAYFRKDYRTAKSYLQRVLKVRPDHIPSKSMLNSILLIEKEAGRER